MPTFLLWHRHRADQCAVAFAAWRGFDSPLRRSETLGSCREGMHELWWTIEAEDEDEARSRLPDYVARRTHAVRVSEVAIP